MLLLRGLKLKLSTWSSHPHVVYPLCSLVLKGEVWGWLLKFQVLEWVYCVDMWIWTLGPTLFIRAFTSTIPGHSFSENLVFNVTESKIMCSMWESSASRYSLLDNATSLLSFLVFVFASLNSHDVSSTMWMITLVWNLCVLMLTYTDILFWRLVVSADLLN